MENEFKKGKDLTKEPPRSPHEKMGGFKILARAIDKCRATLWGNAGLYNFDCPVDNTLFAFKGIKGEDFKKYVEEGHSDEEITAWLKEQGTPRTNDEIEAWNEKVSAENYSTDPGKAAWLSGEVKKLGMPEGTTLFDWLDEDDKVSFV